MALRVILEVRRRATTQVKTLLERYDSGARMVLRLLPLACLPGSLS
jgi:predicted nucleotide-binding protein (sugar kinase/HSP70/actin superfamily)